MGQQQDHGYDGQEQHRGRGPGHTVRAGFGPQGEHPSTRPPRTPPQFRPEAPPREDGYRLAPQQYAQPGFTPAYQPGDPWEASAGGSWQPSRSRYAPPSPQPWQQPQGYQAPYRPEPYSQPYRAPGPRRKPRVFLWVFLGIQALFLIWIIAGVASHPAGPTAAQQAAQQCANGGWQGLFKSQADCQVHYAHALNEAGNVGKGLGVAAIVIFWVVVDFFVGLGYGIYRLASRR